MMNLPYKVTCLLAVLICCGGDGRESQTKVKEPTAIQIHSKQEGVEAIRRASHVAVLRRLGECREYLGDLVGNPEALRGFIECLKNARPINGTPIGDPDYELYVVNGNRRYYAHYEDTSAILSIYAIHHGSVDPCVALKLKGRGASLPLKVTRKLQVLDRPVQRVHAEWGSLPYVELFNSYNGTRVVRYTEYEYGHVHPFLQMGLSAGRTLPIDLGPPELSVFQDGVTTLAYRSERDVVDEVSQAVKRSQKEQ